jgi:hypothetical protein
MACVSNWYRSFHLRATRLINRLGKSAGQCSYVWPTQRLSSL